MKRILLVLIALTLFSNISFSQKKVRGDLQVNGKVIFGSFTTAERLASSVDNGTVVYDADLAELWSFENGAWKPLDTAGGPGGSSCITLTENSIIDTCLNDTLFIESTETFWQAASGGGIDSKDSSVITLDGNLITKIGLSSRVLAPLAGTAFKGWGLFQDHATNPIGSEFKMLFYGNGSSLGLQDRVVILSNGSPGPPGGNFVWMVMGRDSTDGNSLGLSVNANGAGLDATMAINAFSATGTAQVQFGTGNGTTTNFGMRLLPQGLSLVNIASNSTFYRLPMSEPQPMQTLRLPEVPDMNNTLEWYSDTAAALVGSGIGSTFNIDTILSTNTDKIIHFDEIAGNPASGSLQTNSGTLTRTDSSFIHSGNKGKTYLIHWSVTYTTSLDSVEIQVAPLYSTGLGWNGAAASTVVQYSESKNDKRSLSGTWVMVFDDSDDGKQIALRIQESTGLKSPDIYVHRAQFFALEIK